MPSPATGSTDLYFEQHKESNKMEMSQRATPHIKKRQQYVRTACNQCKRRKVKCSGEPCCQQCMNHKVLCTYDRMASLQDSNFRVSSTYESLKGRLLQLQSSLDQALKHMKESSQGREAHDMELEALLLQTAQRIDTCRIGAQVGPLTGRVRSGVLAGQETVGIRPSVSHLPTWNSFTLPLSFTTDKFVIPNLITPEKALFPFSKTQTFELIEYFRFEAECFYPFIPLDCLASLACTVIDSPCSALDIAGTETRDWGDMLDSRNLDLLRLLLGCAIMSKMNRETEISSDMISIASKKLTTKVNGPKFDTKDIAITTLLSVYYLQCDETILAWRKISIAAKMCQELGLHKSTSGQPSWVSRMFWSIYVLDKRFSFMTNFPFTLHDADIDYSRPESDHSRQYTSSLIKYVRIAAKFVPKIPRLGGNYTLMEPSIYTSLDIEADQWALSTSIDYPFARERDDSSHYKRAHMDEFHEAFVAVCRNQLKISLYKHNLFSPDSVRQNLFLSHKAVFSASHSIRTCRHLQTATAMYKPQAVHFNFFVLSAVAALYLAIKHAPLEFSYARRDIFTGLEILTEMGSERLCEKVRTLENAIKRLEFGVMGIGAELNLHETSTSHDETLCTIESAWSKETEVGEELMALVPRSGSFSSFLSQTLAAEPRNGTYSPTHSQQPWDSWEIQEWIF